MIQVVPPGYYVVRGPLVTMDRQRFVELHGDPITIVDPETGEVLGTWSPWVRGFVSVRRPRYCIVVVISETAYRNVQVGWRVLPPRKEKS